MSVRTQVRGVWLAGVVGGALFVLVAAGVLLIVRPTRYEFDAFVTLPIVNGDLLAPREEIVEYLNGFGFATAVAGDLGESPWAVWRSFTVVPEGRALTISTWHDDRSTGERWVAAAQRRVLESLNEKYDAIMTPHHSYRSSLEAQIAGATTRGERDLGTVAAEGGRESVRARLERELRDVRVIEARSQPSRATHQAISRGTDINARRRLYLMTGVAGGILSGLVVAGLILRGRW